MNFTFHIFGNPAGRYGQYPADYSSHDNRRYADDVKGRRLVISRDKVVSTYRYYQSLGNDRYVGFTITCNGMQFTRPKGLMDVCAGAVDMLVASGALLRCDNRGNIDYVKGFEGSPDEIDDVRSYLAFVFETKPEAVGCDMLKGRPYDEQPAFKNYMESESEIEAQTYLNTVVIVDDDRPVRAAYLQRMISETADNLDEAEATINELEEDNKRLERQKKQFKVVLLLMSLLVLAGVWLVSIRGNLKETRDNLSHTTRSLNNANQEIIEKTGEIEDLTLQRDGFRRQYQALADRIREISQKKGSLHQYTYMSGWYSNNHGDATTSGKEYEFYAFPGDVFTMNYNVDSESNCDFLGYRLYGPGTSSSQKYSGRNSGKIDVTLGGEGIYSLYVYYTKDGSVSKFSDSGRFTNLELRRAEISNIIKSIESAVMTLYDSERNINAFYNNIGEEAVEAEAACDEAVPADTLIYN